VANKVREDGDAELVAQRTGLRVIGSVPYDTAFAEAERLALAPIDHVPDSLAVRAVESLVSQLIEEFQP
jgi:CO dehydrogenase nickel-insertion accessory protein CooC1